MVWKAVIEASSRKSVATALNDYFASVGRLLAEKFSQSFNYVNPAKLNVAEPATVTFELRTVSHSFVLQQICALKCNKAIGLDRISARLLKCASRTITLSFTKLLNLSIATNEFPNIWKCAKVTALFKAGNRTSPSDYRPILFYQLLVKSKRGLCIINFINTLTNIIYSMKSNSDFGPNIQQLTLCLVSPMKFCLIWKGANCLEPYSWTYLRPLIRSTTQFCYESCHLLG